MTKPDQCNFVKEIYSCTLKFNIPIGIDAPIDVSINIFRHMAITMKFSCGMLSLIPAARLNMIPIDNGLNKLVSADRKTLAKTPSPAR